MNLLHLLGWIVDNTEIEIHTLILKHGPLVGRFEQLGEVTVLDRSGSSTALALAHDGLVRLGSRRMSQPLARARLVPQLRHLQNFDVAYLNSVTSIRVAPYLPPVAALASHVHELQVALRNWQPAYEREWFESLPDVWIAASGAVRDLLVDEVALPDHRVLVHHEFIDTAALTRRTVGLREIEALRSERGIPAQAPIVLGAGTIDWRKGPDLFVQLATEVRRRTREPVAFVWVGGTLHGPEWERVRSDIERSGADHVYFVGTHWDPLPWFAAADVFALTSREDPFPLVALEHAVLGHPIVAYDSGGIGELLRAAGPQAALGLVGHLDVAAMADAVLAYLESDPLRRAAGRQLSDRVVTHHDVRVAAPRLLADLNAMLAGAGSGAGSETSVSGRPGVRENDGN